MDINVQTASGSKKIQIEDSVMDVPFQEGMVHQVVTAYLAGARAGTKKQKTRSEVSGGGAKPWKQKGTGRARAGTIRSPIWRKGGVTFAAKPRDFSQKVNKKVYRKAICCILAELYRNNHLLVVDSLSLETPKTKEFLQYVEQRKLGSQSILMITDEVTENLYLATRNLFNVEIVDTNEVNPYVMMKFEKVLITEKAMTQLEERLK
jgi:large subunit ribosomal protein L4